MSAQLLPPPLFDLDPSERVERKRTPRPRPEDTLPPPLFDRETSEYVLTPGGQSPDHCGLCRRPMKRLAWTHMCGGGRAGGSFVLCDECAATDDVQPNGLSRWGFSPTMLEMERIRRRVYAAGGGETEVVAEFARAGLHLPEVSDA